MARALRGKKTCTQTDPPSDGCDNHGNVCTLCGMPLPGRGYDGRTVYSSTIRSAADVPSAPNHVYLDSCGGVGLSLESVTTPLVSYTRNTSNGSYPGYTNAWCELNIQRVAADSFANRDYLLQAKSLNIPRGHAYDFWYCKYNGFLSRAARTAAAAGHGALQRYAVDFCTARAREFDLENITFQQLWKRYSPGLERGGPTEDEARFVGAWLCAMGGSDGRAGSLSDGPGPDIGLCTYTYGDLSSNASGHFCMYDECDGWDPARGVPVADTHTSSRGHTPPDWMPAALQPGTPRRNHTP